jgi:TFIIF-interacting CTD phosphatase-like protein
MELNFILDLDQTIISSERLNERIKGEDKKILTFEVEENGLKVEKKISLDDIGTCHYLNPYYIVERPYLQEFLDFLFENFNVSVWTAGTKDYAKFICEKVILKKPERKLNYFLYLEHCQMSSGKHVKSLNFLFQYPGFERNNTILLDDSEDHIKHDIINSSLIIRAKEFFFLDEGKEDNFLEQLQEQLQKQVVDKKKLVLRNSISKINNFFKN